MNEKFAKIREELNKNDVNEDEIEMINITIEARKSGKKWIDIIKAFEKEKIFVSAGQLRYKLKKLEQNTTQN